MIRTKANPTVSDDYLDLVRRFPLRPLRSEREHDSAIAVLRSLVTRGEENLRAGELDYVEGLTRFVVDYEQAHHRIALAQLTSLDKLKHLMRESGMTPGDLGRLLGSQPAASLILHGKRQLSKAHMRKLAGRFHVDAGYFL
jgi:HTH-type transcriptional regulator/antitoxin HigA